MGETMGLAFAVVAISLSVVWLVYEFLASRRRRQSSSEWLAEFERANAEQLEREGGLADPFEAALNAAIEELLIYDGEPVVKGEHSLHRRVCALEKLCRRNSLDRIQPYQLFGKAHGHWCRLLWSSRGKARHFSSEAKPNPDEAQRHANRLLVELVAWKTEPEYLKLLRQQHAADSAVDVVESL